MTLFWIISAGLTGLALVFAVLPLLRRKRVSEIDADNLNLEVFRDQMAELEADLASGDLDQEQYNASKRDLEKELLIDIPKDGERPAKTPEKSGRWAIAVVAVGIPVMAIGLYQTLGTPEIIARLENPPAAPQPGNGLPPMISWIVGMRSHPVTGSSQ